MRKKKYEQEKEFLRRYFEMIKQIQNEWQLNAFKATLNRKANRNMKILIGVGSFLTTLNITYLLGVFT